MRWSLLLLVLFFCGCPRPCDSSTCDGCCASTTECVEGTAKLECGSGGQVCERCSSTEHCVAQKCEALPVVDAGVIDAGPPVCVCATSCCLPDGSCAPNNGIDACGPNKQFCGTCAANQRCEAGTCVSGACGGCLDPLGTCRSGNDDVACGTDGGVCVACGTDQACMSGHCAFTRCDLMNCRFGCCRTDKSCNAPTVLACGLGGDPCQACTTGQQCLGGSCQ